MNKLPSVVALAACLSLASSLAVQSSCPHLRHCVCTFSGAAICHGEASIPANLPNNTNFFDFTNNFLNSVLRKSQVDTLGGLPLIQLFLNNNNLAMIEDESFNLLHQLTTLDLSSNKLNGLSEKTFAGLKSLQYLYLNDIGLVGMPPSIFHNVPTLVYLDLEDNYLTKIELEFSSLNRLTTLLLADNKISEISQFAFVGLEKLNHLSLFGNNLHKPLWSWFRSIIKNNGRIELNWRTNSSVAQPNPWLCCPEIGRYHNFIRNADKSLRSYAQLDVVCSWPVSVSGRLLSTLTTDEVNAVPCANYTLPTITPDFKTTETTTPTPAKGLLIEANFFSGMSDVGVVIILLLIAAIAGCLVGGLCCCYRTKKGRQAIHSFVDKFRFGKSENNEKSSSEQFGTELTTRPYRQNSPAYDASNPINRQSQQQSKRPVRPAPAAPPNGIYTPVVKPAEQDTYANYTMETDQSEDEVWSKTERKSPV